MGGGLRRAARPCQAPQQGGGDHRDDSDRLDVHAGGGTDGPPAEAERRGVGGGLRDEQVSSELQQVRQVQSLSAAQDLLQLLDQMTSQINNHVYKQTNKQYTNKTWKH